MPSEARSPNPNLYFLHRLLDTDVSYYFKRPNGQMSLIFHPDYFLLAVGFILPNKLFIAAIFWMALPAQHTLPMEKSPSQTIFSSFIDHNNHQLYILYVEYIFSHKIFFPGISIMMSNKTGIRFNETSQY